ncbi:hypothetical protein B0H15DRAFT_972043 [Mycena belliarum]|uniref:Protein kinase domain-containing protein n=1 Tax=Mycena belliarum TaxID=1033014 RepID=A0AAD6TNE3_9AGAR|nr:hypothetical protein B0H15DRAFT_972043 [Mycena belliae]
MADRPTTPPQNTPPSFSTPASRGSASHGSYSTQHTQEDYLPYLREDLATAKTVTFDHFLELVLPSKTDHPTLQQLKKISEDHRVQASLSKYKAVTVPETSLYQPFVELANQCMELLPTKGAGVDSVFCRNDPAIVRGSRAQRKPDVGIVKSATLRIGHRDSADNLADRGPSGDNAGPAFHWAELLGFYEFKLDDPPVPKAHLPEPRVARPSGSLATTSRAKRPANTSGSSSKRPRSPSPKDERPTKRSNKSTPELQCASYAVELMSHGGLRSHVIGALVTPSTIVMLYYDHSITVKSEPLHFTTDLIPFLTMLSRIASLTLAEWGYPEILRGELKGSEPKGPDPLLDNEKAVDFRGMKLDLANGWTLELDTNIFRAHGLIGRGTCVVGATVIKTTKDDMPEDKRVAVKWTWVPRTRTAESAIIALATAYAKSTENADMLSHLPHVLYSQDFEDLDYPQRPLFEAFRDSYELRTLRITVQEVLHPIANLTTSAELSLAIQGIFKCYRWLYEKVKIMHRDISLGNLMYRQMEGGKVIGVLNDFDFALHLTAIPLSTSKQRTGTKPYMARDLLVPSPPRHLYRHDLESLFYVLASIATGFHEGKPIMSAPLWKWHIFDMGTLLTEKQAFLSQSVVTTTAHFAALRLWILTLRAMFQRGNTARQDHAILVEESMGRVVPVFDEETLGGQVTFDAFAACIGL